MPVCMHMCIYKNASVHVYCVTEHIGVCICVCAYYVFSYTQEYACMYVHVCISLLVFRHRCVYMSMPVFVPYVQTYIHKHVDMCVPVYAHVNTSMPVCVPMYAHRCTTCSYMYSGINRNRSHSQNRGHTNLHCLAIPQLTETCPFCPQ